MTSDEFEPPKPSLAVPHSTAVLSKSLRIALWASPAIAVGSWLAQAVFRFPGSSRGAGLTAVMLVLGVVLGGVTALFAGYQFIRRPGARTKTASILLGINSVLLLAAVAIVPNLIGHR
jgi:hypothetical protein